MLITSAISCMSIKMKKIVMFEVTHIYAVDGYSQMIIGFLTIPVKNTEIYSQLYKLVQ